MDVQDKILKKLTQIDSRLDGIDSKFDGIDCKMDSFAARQDKADARVADLTMVQDKLVKAVLETQTDVKDVKAKVASLEINQRQLADNVEGFVKLHTTLDCEVAAMRSRNDRFEDRLTRVEKTLKLKVA